MSITFFTMISSIIVLFITYIICYIIFEDIAASIGSGIGVFVIYITLCLFTFINFSTEQLVQSYKLISTDYVSTGGSTYKYQPTQTYVYYLNENNQIMTIPINEATIYYTNEESRIDVYSTTLWFLYNNEYVVYLKQD